MESQHDDDVNMIVCEGLGPIVFTDDEGRKFYTAYEMSNLVVRLGDCVRVNLEDDATTNAAELPSTICAFAQVLAIYVDTNEEMFIEVRWFLQPHELSSYHRKIISPIDNELIESEQLDDIAAGAVSELIEIKGVGINQNRTTSEHYVCRYLDSNNSRAMQKILPLTMFKRGMEYSQYKYAYVEYVRDQTNPKEGLENDVYSIAIQRLHISVIPETLPCRQNERNEIEGYIRDGLKRGKKSPLYICGMPGTGKTATVLASVNNLRKQAEVGTLPEFSFIEINCLRLKSPSDAYTQLWRGLSGYHLSPKAALKKLSTYFTDKIFVSNATKDRKSVLVCLMDELDYLLTRDFKVIYNFFDWPMQQEGFLLVGIANTMNLPETISSRIESRTKLQISRLTFSPYSFQQITEILEQRLSELQLQSIDSTARALIARKAASIAGDLRAALKICQSVIELFRDHNLQKDRSERLKGASAAGISVDPQKAVTVLSLIKAAVDKYKETPFISMVARLSTLEKSILLCFCKHRKIVCGGDEHSSSAGMTLHMAWQRFEDLILLVHGHAFYDLGDSVKIGDVSGVNDVNSVVVAGVNTSATSTPANSFASSSQSMANFELAVPPMHIFRQAIDMLISKGIIFTTCHYRPCGRVVELYHVNSSLLFSDFVAAMSGDPLARFATTT